MRFRGTAGCITFCMTCLPLAFAQVLPVQPDSDGVLTAKLPGVSGDTASLRLPPLVVDGRSQTDLQLVADQPNVLENDAVRLTITPAGEGATALTWTALDNQLHDFEIRLHDNSDFYGGGERFHALNQKGHVLQMLSRDHPAAKGSVAYRPVPFMYSTRGYGFWLDTCLPGRFDLNVTERYNVILCCRATELRLVLIGGPSFAEVLDGFTRLTGRPRIPPQWAFAPWKSRDVHRNREDVLEDVELHRKYDIPASVLVIDSPWETAYNDFVLNEQQFSEPDRLFARVRELGFYPIFWLTPFVNSRNVQDMRGIDGGPAANFAQADDAGYLVQATSGEPYQTDWWKGRGALVDFTNPAACDWWHAQLAKTLQWGARGFKCDDGEGAFIDEAVFHDGTSWRAMRNRYSVLYLATMQDFIDERLDGDGVLISRAGYTGTQRYPLGWAGDNEATFDFDNGLPGVILAGQNAALSGHPMWGSDIAGYIGTQSPELFVRWTQFAAFSPLMMVHMQSNRGPWDFNAQTLAIYRDYAKLHTRLFPYLYAAAQDAHETGMPIIRPMVLAFPEQPESHGEIFQFLCGPDLLVAPMYRPGTSRSVFLPAGEWIDYWSGKPYDGPRTVEARAPLERIPLYVRAGAILEMLPADVDTLIPQSADMSPDVVAIDDRRLIQVWPGAEGELISPTGLRVTTRRAGTRRMLVVRSPAPRRIGIQLAHQHARTSDISGDVDRIRSEPFGTRIQATVGAEPLELSWTIEAN